MKLQYLGTAAAEGWPGLFCTCPACLGAAKRGGKNIRTRSQAVVDDKLLLDFCPDTYHHMITYGLDLPHISHCLITHTHEDHLYYKDLMMRSPGYATIPGTSKPFTLYGSESVVKGLEDFRESLSNKDELLGVEWKELPLYQPTVVDGYTVTPTRANHFYEEVCYNYIIEKDGKCFFYGHDTGELYDDVFEEFKKHHFDLVSLDCTMLHHWYRKTHMNIEACCEVREKMLLMGCADENTKFIINHFSHNGSVNQEELRFYLHEELVPYMAERGFEVSYDGMIVEF